MVQGIYLKGISVSIFQYSLPSITKFLSQLPSMLQIGFTMSFTLERSLNSTAVFEYKILAVASGF